MAINYRERIIDRSLTEKMRIAWAILVRGPKRCWKTTTCKQYAKSFVEIQEKDSSKWNPSTIALSELQPSLLLKWDKPRLIDERQLAPDIWNTIRHDVDDSWLMWQYLLTGSATPNERDNSRLHTWTWRFAYINMKTMSLYESGDSNWKISLNDILNWEREINWITSDISYERMAFLICRWWRPSIFNIEDENDQIKIADNYITSVCEIDISAIDNVKRNPELARAILESYARLDSTIESNQTLIDDVLSTNNVWESTINLYLSLFKKLYILDEISARNPNIRSKTSIRTAPKKSFTDPSLAAALLNVSPEELALDPNTYWLLFENLVDRDLSIYINSIWWTLNHYRDRYWLECDQVAHFRNGRYALIETKIWSERSIKEAEDHLLQLKKLINEKWRLRNPEFLMIVTNTPMAYITTSWILVVPIGCLKN